jgi:hypothetical protein
MNNNFISKFKLNEALYLGFCATFIVITRAVLRLHLSVPGHAMFFTMFFLMLGRGCVPKMWAATFIGLVAGVICAALGMGKGGPLVIIKFVLPGVIVDCCGAFYPGLFSSFLGCMIAGAIASASRALTLVSIDWLVGMEKTLIVQHVLVVSFMNVLFGALGSMMVPPVFRKLKAHNLVG